MKSKLLVLLCLTTLAALPVLLITNSSHPSNFPAELLTHNDKPKKNADFLLILMGGVVERTHHAVELYKKGYAKKIIFAEAEFLPITRAGYRWSDGTATSDLLKAEGVKTEDIIFLRDTRNTSTKEELRTLLHYIPQHFPGPTRVIIATSWYHSARAHYVANKYRSDRMIIESYPTELPQYFWKTEKDFLSVFLEYLKWLYYLATNVIDWF